MRIHYDKVTWYSTILTVVSAVGIFALGFYIGSLYQQGRTAMEFAENIVLQQEPITERLMKSIEPSYLFIQEGNIENRATGEKEVDEWVLLYKQPGAPALTRMLIFTTQSRCAIDSKGLTFCNTATFTQGQRVRVKGDPDADGTITVKQMELIQ